MLSAQERPSQVLAQLCDQHLVVLGEMLVAPHHDHMENGSETG
jgi:hypothetical protein